MRPRFSWLPNVGLLIGSVVVTLFVLEFGLRITGLSDTRPTPPRIYQASDDPEISYELIPSSAETAFRNTVTVNRLGFRSPEPIEGKPLVAVLGDSITFGYGLADDETLTRRLEAHVGTGAQFLNTAVPGYNLLQETATYEKKIRPLTPDALVLVFYWNDLKDVEPAVLNAEGNLVPKNRADVPTRCNPIEEGVLGSIPGRCWLDLHSALYRAVKKVVSRRTEQKNLAQQVEAYKASPFAEEQPPERLDDYARTLDRLAKTLPEGLPRLFVIWPDKHLHFTYRPRLRQIAEARGFKVLDLYEVFGNEAKTLSWDTVHPAADTVDRAAAVIAAAMTEWNLLPR